MARGPLVLLRGYFVVLRLGVLMQVGRRHGAQRGALAAHTGETARSRNTTLWRGDILSVGSREKKCSIKTCQGDFLKKTRLKTNLTLIKISNNN